MPIKRCLVDMDDFVIGLAAALIFNCQFQKGNEENEKPQE
jgi:hypothetical protein